MKLQFESSIMSPIQLIGFLTAALCFAGSAEAQQDASASLLELEEQAFVEAIDAASGVVVQIETYGGLEQVDQEVVGEGPTTGTVVDEDGWIISSLFSFRQQPASILVAMPNGKRVPARVVARDFSRDLVLLKADIEQELDVAKAADLAKLRVGEWVIALGKTYDRATVSQSVGIVSAIGRAYGKAIQTDAKISPINYGGPLVNLKGEVVGILSALSPGPFLEGNSAEIYDSGIGFAVPLSDVQKWLQEWKKGKDIYAGKFGEVTADQNEMTGPVMLTGATPGSPAAKAGVKAGDVIISAAGKPTRLLADLKHAYGPLNAGDNFEFSVLREVDGELRERKLSTTLAKEIPIYRDRFLGLYLLENEEGLQVTDVESDTPAFKAGIKSGDYLRAYNGEPLTNTADLEGFLAVAELDEPVSILFERDGKDTEVELLVAEWPDEISEAELPSINEEIDEEMKVEVIDIALGDVPNKIFGVIPPLADQRKLGVLVFLPEPGKFEQDRAVALWEDFARDRGWIVVVINSASPRAWSIDEIELGGRILGRMQKSYNIDTRRCAVAGLGVGGKLAILTGARDRQRFAGVLSIGTGLRMLPFKQDNEPLKTLKFLLMGKTDELEGAAAALKNKGYGMSVVEVDYDREKLELLPFTKINAWLEQLGRY